ncbi:MAG: TIGR03905 family TSCPD domain-containing protein [Christensenellaceae bacterium]|jgi:uncharacterized protein (TIGR03905 family)|nr:TIGR03905 family TSCPD domain-containing protein [Christensenellaceae bacterium]
MRYQTQGVCASFIDYEVDEKGVLRNVHFHGGCPGNGRAVAALVEGMPVDEAVKRLRGIQCRGGTSCADQFARALSGVK